MNQVTSLDEAVTIARYYITEIDPQVVADHARQGKVIVRRADGGHSVYQADAWQPRSGGMLPWSKPEGTPVARVLLDLTVEAVSEPERVEA